MNLAPAIVGKKLGGMQPLTLREMLERGDSIISSTNGLIIFDDGTMLNCVEDYYELGKIKSLSNKCFEIHKKADIQRVSPNQCRQCHIACIQKKEDGELKLK